MLGNSDYPYQKHLSLPYPNPQGKAREKLNKKHYVFKFCLHGNNRLEMFIVLFVFGTAFRYLLLMNNNVADEDVEHVL